MTAQIPNYLELFTFTSILAYLFRDFLHDFKNIKK